MHVYDISVPLDPDTPVWDEEPAPKLETRSHVEWGDHESTDFAVHRTLLAAGVVVLEGVDLRAVPPGEYLLVCAPLKLVDAEGAPARAFLIDGYPG